MNYGQNGRFHPITWLNFVSYGQNGRSPPHPLTKLDELWAERPFPPHPWLNLMNRGQNGRSSPHHLTKLDELRAERPFPTSQFTIHQSQLETAVLIITSETHCPKPPTDWRLASEVWHDDNTGHSTPGILRQSKGYGTVKRPRLRRADENLDTVWELTKMRIQNMFQIPHYERFHKNLRCWCQ